MTANFEYLAGKNIKIVWKDLNANGENKAIYGILKEVSDSFVLIISNGNPVYLNISAIITLKEHEQK